MTAHIGNFYFILLLYIVKYWSFILFLLKIILSLEAISFLSHKAQTEIIKYVMSLFGTWNVQKLLALCNYKQKSYFGRELAKGSKSEVVRFRNINETLDTDDF